MGRKKCIIVGKAANMVLKDFDNVISVYIEAPRKACVESITRKLGISEKEAHKLISETDKYRYDYYKYYTHGKDWRDPVAYDMTINSDRVGRDKAVDLICQYRKIKFGEDAKNDLVKTDDDLWHYDGSRLCNGKKNILDEKAAKAVSWLIVNIANPALILSGCIGNTISKSELLSVLTAAVVLY